MRHHLCFTRTRIILLGVITTVLVAGFMVAWHYGPYREFRQACTFCGQGRVQQWWLGMTTGPSETSETSWTRWVRELHPEHEDHTWIGIGFTSRGWFGPTRVGCGGLGISAFYRLRQDVGEQEAQQRLAVYHDLVERDPRSGLTYAVGVSDLSWAH